MESCSEAPEASEESGWMQRPASSQPMQDSASDLAGAAAAMLAEAEQATPAGRSSQVSRNACPLAREDESFGAALVSMIGCLSLFGRPAPIHKNAGGIVVGGRLAAYWCEEADTLSPTDDEQEWNWHMRTPRARKEPVIDHMDESVWV